jgi:putative transposase
MLAELWVEGVIVEFKDEVPCHRAIIRQVGKNEIVFANILNGSVHKFEKLELDNMNDSGLVKFLAESRDFGDLKFIDLSEKEQIETNRRYRYVKNLQENGITKITEKSSNSIIYETAKSLNEKAPHWQSVRNWYGQYVSAGRKMRGLYPKHRYKGSHEPKIDKRVLSIIRKEAKGYFKESQPSVASVVRNVEAKIIQHNLDNQTDTLIIPTYVTIQKGC